MLGKRPGHFERKRQPSTGLPFLFVRRELRGRLSSEVVDGKSIRGQRSSPSSEVVVPFRESERAVAVARENILDPLAGVSEIQTYRDSVTPLVVATDVVQVGQLGRARRPALKNKIAVLLSGRKFH